MTYSEQYFGKKLNELDFSDIETYFKEKREETETIEFKSGLGNPVEMTEKVIPRVICSFLNSSGGVLIWGTPKEEYVDRNDKSKGKVCQGDLAPVEVHKEKDQLINIISRKISYMPTGISMVRLENNDSYVYVFEVKESNTKPYQFNGSYYIRLDGQCKPAPHYIVDALFRQVVMPDIDMRVNFTEINISEDQHHVLIKMEILINNFTEVVNEKMVSYQLVSSLGYFDNHWMAVIHSEPINFLYYGRPVKEHQTLVIDVRELAQKNYTFRIALAFAGEKSVAKSCDYVLNLKDLEEGTFDFKKLVTSCVENKTFKERQEELGASKETFLKAVLNR